MWASFQTRFFTFLAFLSFLLFFVSEGGQGFYYDDWHLYTAFHGFGLKGFIDHVGTDRPFSAFSFLAVMSLLGKAPVMYHLFATGMWFVCGVVYYKMMMALSDDRLFASLCTVGFIVFPQFTAWGISLNYSVIFLPLIAMMASLLLTLKAIKAPEKKRLFHGLAVAASLYTYITVPEYYVGLDAVRFCLIAYFVKEQPLFRRLGKALWTFLPYLAIMASAVVLRLAFSPTRSDVNQDLFISHFQRTPLGFLVGRAKMAANDIYHLLLGDLHFHHRHFFSHWPFFMVLVPLFALGGYLIWRKNREAGFRLSGGRYLKTVGALVLFTLFVGVPFWFAHFTLESRPLAGAILAPVFPVATAFFLFRKQGHRVAALMLLFVFGAYSQMKTGARFSENWHQQNKLFAEIQWRIPNVSKPTYILYRKPADYLRYAHEFSIGPPLAWHYGQQIEMEPRLWPVGISRYDKQQLLEWEHRTHCRAYRLDYSLDKALLVQIWPDRCARVVTQDNAHYTLPPDYLGEIAHLACQDCIDYSQPLAIPPDLEKVLDLPDTNCFCYHLQKADAALEQGNPAVALDHYQRIKEQGLSPESDEDFLVFLEAALLEKDAKTAEQIALEDIADAAVRSIALENVGRAWPGAKGLFGTAVFATTGLAE